MLHTYGYKMNSFMLAWKYKLSSRIFKNFDDLSRYLSYGDVWPALAETILRMPVLVDQIF